MWALEKNKYIEQLGIDNEAIIPVRTRKGDISALPISFILRLTFTFLPIRLRHG